MRDFESNFIERDGNKIHYYTSNQEKPTVILLHGALDNGLCWTPVATELSKDYNVIMPDARAHGLTEVKDDDYSYNAMAEDVGFLIEYLCLKQVFVIGHSMGGTMAAQIASKFPDAIDKVVLEDPAFILRRANFLTKFVTKN